MKEIIIKSYGKINLALDILYKRFVQEKKSYCSDRTIEYYKVNIKDFIDYYLINHNSKHYQ